MDWVNSIATEMMTGEREVDEETNEEDDGYDEARDNGEL